jgi:hypothetical protein
MRRVKSRADGLRAHHVSRKTVGSLPLGVLIHMGVTGGGGMQKEGPTLAFWFWRTQVLSRSGSPADWRQPCHDLSYTVGLLCSFTTKRRGRGKAADSAVSPNQKDMFVLSGRLWALPRREPGPAPMRSSA